MQEKYQKITVGGLLIKDNKALIVRRSAEEGYLTGFYELPGGKIDFGETPEQSLEREFFEETNIKVKTVKPFRIFTYISHDNNRHTVEIVYLVKAISDTNVKLSQEHDDYKWIALEEINRFNVSDEIKTNIVEGFKLI